MRHSIDIGDAKPFRQTSHLVLSSERETIEKVNNMLFKEIIRHSSSYLSSPVVLLSKKDGSLRICVNSWRLNKVTSKDVYPMPKIDEALNALRGARYISTLYLRSGYWHIPMADEDKDKTAFVTLDGLFEVNVMPFSISNAPEIFE